MKKLMVIAVAVLLIPVFPADARSGIHRKHVSIHRKHARVAMHRVHRAARVTESATPPVTRLPVPLNTFRA